MKKTLIPTDFSPIADNALNYAIEIGSKFSSDLYLYHVYNIDRNMNYDSNFPPEEQPFKKQVEAKMKVCEQQFLEKITQKGLLMKTKVEKAHISTLFKEKAMEYGTNLIVMGSKGASGLERVIFGSVAATALELAKVPLLVIPPNHSFNPIKKIVFATDLNEVAPKVLLPLQKIAFEFGATVTILNVKKGSNKDSTEHSKLHLNNIEKNYQEIPMSQNINESLNEFVEKNKPDLLCMVRRKKGFFQSLFQKSTTKTQVYKSNIPLLILPED